MRRPGRILAESPGPLTGEEDFPPELMGEAIRRRLEQEYPEAFEP